MNLFGRLMNMFIWDVVRCYYFNMFNGEFSVVSLVGIYMGCGGDFCKKSFGWCVVVLFLLCKFGYVFCVFFVK